ncbi:MAG: Unknown protein [uncultured Sulfurovum sp.]|uniref:Uncharacterized protein n=1 Tax=uncultured Sulfurovum sp. TaxID=269237 RepID=A0A6S6RYF4_9BACT|nr:MAG: Unknown protein [uncultured Sulfurovum sp.]
MENFKKLNYILNSYMTATEVTHAFGFKSETMISKMRKGENRITQLHIDGLEKYFNIPPELFNITIKNEDEIDLIIKTYQLQKQKDQKKLLEQTQDLSPYCKIDKNIFPENPKLFEKIKGTWYGYVYPSNPASSEHGIWEVKTIIGEDYSVIDEPWGNKGYLKLGKNESLIIKESYDHEDLTTIRFSNRQVPSGHFRFVVISNQNHTLNEMVNFGFFSRKRYPLDEAKEILGDRESKQLKLDVEFNERLIQRAIVPQ